MFGVLQGAAMAGRPRCARAPASGGGSEEGGTRGDEGRKESRPERGVLRRRSHGPRRRKLAGGDGHGGEAALRSGVASGGSSERDTRTERKEEKMERCPGARTSPASKSLLGGTRKLAGGDGHGGEAALRSGVASGGSSERDTRTERKEEKMERCPGARTSPASKSLLGGTRRRARGTTLLSWCVRSCRVGKVFLRRTGTVPLLPRRWD